MTVNKSVIHYSRNVHGQPNANNVHASERTNWTVSNVSSSIDAIAQPSGSISAEYSKKIKTKATKKKPATYTIKKPWTLTAHDFLLDIPDCAYIKNITFTVRMKVSGDIKVKAPYARFNFYNGKNNVDTWKVDDTGWDEGYWYYNPSIRLSNSWQNIQYVMSGKEFRKRCYPISELRESRMGIDLRFYDASSQDSSNNVYVQYVSCTVEYELPDQKLTFDTVTSEDNPRMVTAGEDVDITVTYTNQSNASCCNGETKDIKIDLPPNVEVVNAGFNYDNGIWKVKCSPNATHNLFIRLKEWGIGENAIKFSNEEIGEYKYWIYSVPADHDVGKVTPYPQTMQKGVTSCIDFYSKVNAHDGTANFLVNVDTVNNTNPNLVWSIIEGKTSDGVSISESGDSFINFDVPVDTPVDIGFRCCFVPTYTGDDTVSVQLDSNPPVTAPYKCLDAPIFRVTSNPKNDVTDRNNAEIQVNPVTLFFGVHRVATDTELGAYVIDCSVADYDGEMITDDCTLTASIWEKIAYIGVLPLERSHYEPESTFGNDEIFKAYKNKVYAGKSGELDENITLKFKARPKDGATLQGMVELDKPTPINTVPLAFEGDILNHRGWAVFSEVKAKRTNPLWYDYEAKVKYITHDIHTKFQIFKELGVNDVNMPEMLIDTFSLGENLSNGLDVFSVDTDGGFVYDEDGEGARNIFSLDEGQFLSIKTLNSVADVSHIRFDWYSTRIDEFRENNVERIFRLTDKDGNAVLEYEYTNFKFYNDSNQQVLADHVTCDVHIRVKNSTGGWETQTFKDVDLKTEIDIEEIVTDNDNDIFYDVSYEEVDYEDTETSSSSDEFNSSTTVIAPTFDKELYDRTVVYGSSLLFRLNGNKLEIIDEGYNGREVALSDDKSITLLDGEYSFETYWLNLNQDGMTEDVVSYIDIQLAETLLNTQYSEQYSNLIVSPFPIPRKKLVFTRESEEGTIYYFNDEEPFKYLLEPYYQYHCGCDLVTREGTSLFNLNNSYSRYYIENGLVRFGFNKFNGNLSLAKWDNVSKGWITTHYFHIDEDTKFSLKSYSDDKIVIQAGTDTYFTIWRGHPYIMINHPNDTISINSKFNYAFTDKLNDEEYPFPVVFSFLNTDNLLPACIGGKTLDYDCITIDDDSITPGTNHTITLDIPETITAEESATITAVLDPVTNDGAVHFILDGVDVHTANTPFVWNYEYPAIGDHTLQAVYVGDDDDNIAFTDKIAINVQAPEPREGSYADEGTPQAETNKGKYHLTIVSAPKVMTYKDKSEVVLQLTRGQEPMRDMPIELQLPTGHTVTKYTNVNGQVSVVNYDTDYVPGRYQWGGRFYDNIDADHNGKVLLRALKWIEVEKATPSFHHNAKDFTVKKGNSLIIKLKGVEDNLTGKKITYTINGGSRKTKTTNENGNIHIACNSVGIMNIKVSFGGSTRYKELTQKFTVVVA